MRTQEVYRELLPPLCRVARESERGLILKLHPFESLSQRRTIVREVLALKDCEIVTVVDGPLTTELLAQAWCGITVGINDCNRLPAEWHSMLSLQLAGPFSI